MLIFDRKAFKSGMMIIREQREAEGKIEVKELKLKVSDKGKSFEFWDEEKVLAKYPHSFKKA